MKFTYASGDRPLAGYTLQHGIGRGGFGEVYQALSDGGKEVALKLVQRNLEVELRAHLSRRPGLAHVTDVRSPYSPDAAPRANCSASTREVRHSSVADRWTGSRSSPGADPSVEFRRPTCRRRLRTPCRSES